MTVVRVFARTARRYCDSNLSVLRSRALFPFFVICLCEMNHLIILRMMQQTVGFDSTNKMGEKTTKSTSSEWL